MAVKIHSVLYRRKISLVCSSKLLFHWEIEK